MEKVLAARLHAVKVRPYLADALFALRVVEDRSALHGVQLHLAAVTERPVPVASRLDHAAQLLSRR
ncbi:hypothetical protein [Streptomyces sp. NPDC001500]